MTDDVVSKLILKNMFREEDKMTTETVILHTTTNPEAEKQPILPIILQERELFCPLYSIMAHTKMHCDKATCGMVRLCRG